MIHSRFYNAIESPSRPLETKDEAEKTHRNHYEASKNYNLTVPKQDCMPGLSDNISMMLHKNEKINLKNVKNQSKFSRNDKSLFKKKKLSILRLSTNKRFSELNIKDIDQSKQVEKVINYKPNQTIKPRKNSEFKTHKELRKKV